MKRGDWADLAVPGAEFRLRVTPGARRTALERGEGVIRAHVTAAPEDGKANAALIEFVTERLGLPKSAARLVSGQTSRRKILEVDAVPVDAERRLLP